MPGDVFKSRVDGGGSRRREEVKGWEQMEGKREIERPGTPRTDRH